MAGETALEYWHAAAEGDPYRAAVARLISHPNYDSVLRRVTRGALALYDSEPKINTTFSDMGTFGLGLLAFYLDASGGVSHRRLAELSSTSTLLSRGRASAILALLRIKGLVVRDTDAHSHGQMRYLLSEDISKFFKARFACEIFALAAVEPALAPFLEQWDDSQIFSRFIANLGDGFVRTGRQPVHPFPFLNEISARRSGLLILYDLMIRADRGAEFPSLEPFPIVISETARRFSVARSHVSHVIAKLQGAGCLARDLKVGTGQLLPAFRSQIQQYMATGHIACMGSAHATLRESSRTVATRGGRGVTSHAEGV